MKHLLVRVFAAAALIGLAACHSTSVGDTWVAPDVSKLSFKKIVVIAATPDGATRRLAEDTLKARITGVECVPSYSLLGTEADLIDITKIVAALKSVGADGVVVMRPVSDKDKITVVPGRIYPVEYRTFRGYYRRSYALHAYYQEPDEIRTERVVQIETNIYEVAGERLIWSGTSTTTNPGNLQQLVADTADAVRAELVKQKLVPAQP